MITQGEFHQLFFLVTMAVLIVVTVSWVLFIRWSRKDAAKRDKAIRFYDRHFHEPKDDRPKPS